MFNPGDERRLNQRLLGGCAAVALLALLALGVAGVLAFGRDRNQAHYPGARLLTSHSNYGGLHQTLTGLSPAAAAELLTYWRLPAEATPRQAALVVFLAGVARSAAIIVNCDSGAAILPVLTLRLLSEQDAGRAL